MARFGDQIVSGLMSPAYGQAMFEAIRHAAGAPQRRKTQEEVMGLLTGASPQQAQPSGYPTTAVNGRTSGASPAAPVTVPSAPASIQDLQDRIRQTNVLLATGKGITPEQRAGLTNMLRADQVRLNRLEAASATAAAKEAERVTAAEGFVNFVQNRNNGQGPIDLGRLETLRSLVATGNLTPDQAVNIYDKDEESYKNFIDASNRSQVANEKLTGPRLVAYRNNPTAANFVTQLNEETKFTTKEDKEKLAREVVNPIREKETITEEDKNRVYNALLDIHGPDNVEREMINFYASREIEQRGEEREFNVILSDAAFKEMVGEYEGADGTAPMAALNALFGGGGSNRMRTVKLRVNPSTGELTPASREFANKYFDTVEGVRLDPKPEPERLEQPVIEDEGSGITIRTLRRAKKP